MEIKKHLTILKRNFCYSFTYIAGPKLTELLKGGPINVFADGVGNFLTALGLSFAVGKQFAALALSAFALTSLDTATRLGRFIFQEFFSQSNQEESILSNRYFSTSRYCYSPFRFSHYSLGSSL